MNHETIVEILNAAQDPLETFKQLIESTTPQSNSRKAKKIAAEIALKIFNSLKRHRAKPAITAMRALILLVGPDVAMAQIRRDGILRASKYDFVVSTLAVLLRDLTNNSNLYNFRPDDKIFLESASVLHELSLPLSTLRTSIIQRLTKNKRYAIKSMLAEVDSRFCFGSTGRSESLGLNQAWSNEEVAEAFSYLLGLFNSVIGLKQNDLCLTDPHAGYAAVYLELLNDAASICQYKEAEVLIESFPYQARSMNNGVVVEAIDSSVEKSMRLGYIQAEMQINIRRRALTNAREVDTGYASILTLAENFFKQLGERLVRLVEEPIPRYVLKFPVFEDVSEIFRDDRVFLEDMSVLEMLGNEDYVAAGDILHLPVVGEITVIDILKVQRLIQFLHIGLMLAINNHHVIAERAGLQMTSCIPVYDTKALLTMLAQAVGTEKARSMFKILSCDFSKEFVDLQYTPIIVVDDLCMFSMSTFVASNLVRNLLAHYKKRLILRDSKDKDPMQSGLKDALCTAGFMVQDEFDPGTVTDPREIDLFAYKDGHLFLFECKNSFHPCNVYERRTSYQYISYASEQLDLRKAWLTDMGRQEKAYKELGWDVIPTMSIHTCIALGNRVFNGFVCNGHPVRSTHELLNVLLWGLVRFGPDHFRIWSADEFNVNDLIKQIGPNSTIADYTDAMFDVHRIFRIGNKDLVFNTVTIDFEKLDKIVRSRYQPVMRGSTLE